MPELDLRISSNAAELARQLDYLERQQLPYATALALKRMAGLVQTSGRARIEARFTIRSRWVVTSWRSETKPLREMKAEWPDPRIVVGHRDEDMELQEVGGRKGGTHGEPFRAIPSRLTWSQRSSRGVIPESLRHYTLLKEQRGQRVQDRALGSVVKHSRRREKGGSKRAKLRRDARFKELRIAHLLRPYVTIRPRAGLRDQAEATMAAHYSAELRRALQQALETQRVPS